MVAHSPHPTNYASTHSRCKATAKTLPSTWSPKAEVMTPTNTSATARDVGLSGYLIEKLIFNNILQPSSYYDRALVKEKNGREGLMKERM
jgi:hypothetical protein